MSVDFGFSGATLPRKCDKVNSNQDGPKCPLDPYQIDHDQSTFINQQTLKLQEAPDLVPVGELPKHILLSADRTLVNQAVPGTRVTVVGIFSTFSATNKGSKHATRVPYLRLTGIFSETDNLDRSARMFSDEEEQHFRDLAASPDFYEKFSASIAPSIFGNIDMKKAIACLLFGGSKKILPDGMKLRGDINVLMLGDPSTAKSQLLKFAEKVAPISVYTSGKGSSAAGLTASVIRDPSTREFYLEGGAMVLADGGIVCIDEFDKMRDEDRVAIHEAMEQQTISIAKAGITTMLNSRTSVLAAANPIFGRYDDLRSPGENIDFQTTILSRFDLIFIVKDDHSKERDQQIAKHVINVHLNRNTQHAGIEGELDIETMKKYITYAKMTCAPRLSPQAAEKLSSEFVRLRSDVGRLERTTEHRSAIPMTVRQLEAIVRITESLAKMTLSPVATEAHVDEAIRLFTSSTMDAIRQDEGGNMRQELTEKVEQITNLIRNRIAVGSTVLVNRLFAEFNSQGFTDICIERAIYVLVRQETLQYLNSRKMIRRRAL
jgi:DNA replication licensing factor MCM5